MKINKGWHSRGYVPHFDGYEVYQFITLRLYDSVPSHVIDKWKMEFDWTEKSEKDPKQLAVLRKLIQQYADKGYGSCFMRIPAIAEIAQNAIVFFDSERYALIEWCIMPNHVHALIKPLSGYSIPKIIQSWKSFIAHEENKALHRSGKFWMHDYFDRYIRTEEHFQTTSRYIRNNPVSAGLVEKPEMWEWSSAF